MIVHMEDLQRFNHELSLVIYKISHMYFGKSFTFTTEFVYRHMK